MGFVISENHRKFTYIERFCAKNNVIAYFAYIAYEKCLENIDTYEELGTFDSLAYTESYFPKYTSRHEKSIEVNEIQQKKT